MTRQVMKSCRRAEMKGKEEAVEVDKLALSECTTPSTDVLIISKLQEPQLESGESSPRPRLPYLRVLCGVPGC